MKDNDTIGVKGIRQSTVHPRPGGDVGGAVVFLSGDDLADLGVDVSVGDTITHWVEDGDLHVENTGSDE